MARTFLRSPFCTKLYRNIKHLLSGLMINFRFEVEVEMAFINLMAYFMLIKGL